MVYLVVQMLLSLVRFHLFIFALISYTDQKRKNKTKQNKHTNKKSLATNYVKDYFACFILGVSWLLLLHLLGL